MLHPRPSGRPGPPLSTRLVATSVAAAIAAAIAGCSTSPFAPDTVDAAGWGVGRAAPNGPSRWRPNDPAPGPAGSRSEDTGSDPPAVTPTSTADDLVRYALHHSPELEASVQRWRAAAMRVPVAAALPDPLVTIGVFLDEVETRVGAQQGRLGVRQPVPWLDTLRDREDVASRTALAAWHEARLVQLTVAAGVRSSLHELAALDASITVTEEARRLLVSFERLIRVRYRVGTGSHPELIRVQVELGQLDDRAEGLRMMRPALVARLNAWLDRHPAAPLPERLEPPRRVATADAAELLDAARAGNPGLAAAAARTAAARARTELARDLGRPDFVVGVDWIPTNEASAPVPESGDDPVLLTLGIRVPLWRDRVDPAIRASIAERLAMGHDESAATNRLAADIHRTWFEHLDADRRIRLHLDTLIPRATTALNASLAAFRAGEATLLDLLDSERVLLEFELTVARARAERGRTLAALEQLVGGAVPVRPAQDAATTPAPLTSPEERP